MATAPGRTVGWFKLVALWWSAKLILTVLVPLIFAASCFGVGLLVENSLKAVSIAVGIGALVTFLEGWSYLFRMIHPLMIDSNQAVTWAAIQRRLLIYAVLLSFVPIAALIACPIFMLFDTVPTEMGVVATAVVALVVVLLILHEMDGGFVWKYQRGQLVLTEHEVATRTKYLAKGKQFPESSYRFWGGRWISDTTLGPHTQAVGKTRSGKTVTMVLWIQSFIRWLFPGSNWRAVVFDAKGELWPSILGMTPPCPVISLCPIHAEGYAWHIATDINDPSAAKTFAAILVPEEQETQKYFPRSARRILEAVVRLFIRRSPGHWDLQDILHVLNDVSLLRSLLESDTSTRHLVEKYFKPENTWKNTLSTLDVLISRYETVAACWRHATIEGRTISLVDFLNTSSILVISRIQDLRDALDPINRLVLQRLFELMLSGPEVKLLPEDQRPRTYLLLDEIAKCGKIELLDDIMLQGASKGVRVFLAYQSILSMRVEYGDKQADALVGQCSNTAIYQVDRETAEWAARWFGEYEAVEDLQASSGNKLSADHKVNLQRTKLQTLLPSQFTTLPFPHETMRITGYYLTDGIGAYEVSFPFIDQLTPAANIPTIPRRPASQQELPDAFSCNDLERLGLDKLVSAKGKKITPTAEITNTPQSNPSEINTADSLQFIRRMRGQQGPEQSTNR